MPRCKNCQKEISKFDVDICPHCGQKNPIEEGYETMDVTSYIEPTEGDYKLYRTKSRKMAGLLCALLGYFGVHDFYLCKFGRAFIELGITLIVTLGVGFALYFSGLLANCGAFLIPFGAIWVIYALISIVFFKKDNIKDGNGEFLR